MRYQRDRSFSRFSENISKAVSVFDENARSERDHALVCRFLLNIQEEYIKVKTVPSLIFPL